MTIHINFEPIGRRGETPAGRSLLECARQLGVELVSLCGGWGSCGRCKVQVVSGQLSEVTSQEREFLTSEEIAQGYRLACCTTPLSDCLVYVPSESLTAPQRTQVEGLDVVMPVKLPARAHAVQLAAPSLEHGVASPPPPPARQRERSRTAVLRSPPSPPPGARCPIV